LKRKRLPGLKLRDELLRKGKGLKTSKDKKKKKRDKLSSERLRISKEELTTSIKKNKNLKSKEFKCKKLYMKLTMRSERFKLPSITLPALATELIIDAKNSD
jgi:hypothetical protein